MPFQFIKPALITMFHLVCNGNSMRTLVDSHYKKTDEIPCTKVIHI
jgi:hypothetical protein